MRNNIYQIVITWRKISCGWEVGRSSRMGYNFKQSHQGEYPKKLVFAEGWENREKQLCSHCGKGYQRRKEQVQRP